ECAESVAASVCRRELRKAARESCRCSCVGVDTGGPLVEELRPCVRNALWAGDERNYIDFPPRASHGLTASCLGDRSTLPFDRSEQHARTLHWRMPMRLSALRIDDGANTLGCLPLQRMPAPIRQRLRHVRAGEERQPDSDRSDEAIYAYRGQWQRGYGCVL